MSRVKIQILNNSIGVLGVMMIKSLQDLKMYLI